MSNPVPPHYTQATRTVIKYVVVMVIISMLSGISFQESAKKLPDAAVTAGIGLDATLRLALLHGHIIVATVLLPLALLGGIYLSRSAGGKDVSPLTTKMLTRGYLPFITMTVMLMLYKGYHILLSVRGGEMDLLKIDAAFFGGSVGARHGVYGLVHVGMFVTLVWVLVGLWRSLPARRDA